MYGLITTLYGKSQQEHFINLYNDCASSEQMILRATLAEALKDCPRNIPSHGTDWILCTLSAHKKSPEDTARVFQGVMRKLNKISFGMLTDKIKWKEMNDIADDCLIGVGMFRSYMEQLHQRRAAPPIDYYKKAGELAFRRLGFDSISDDFESWTTFIEKELATTSMY